LEDAEIVRAEVPVGASRFDFLLRRGRREVLLEVKSCTLFGNRVAMFPDAVTERGRRHLEELAALSRRGRRPCVLFLVHTHQADWFLPDYHTDLAFSRTLLAVRRKLDVLPVGISWNPDLSLSGEVRPLAVPWDHLRREAEDRGSYLLLLRLARDRRVEIGRLGSYCFARGWYVYVGSAMRSLTARTARHARRRKRLHWHVDHLRQAASEVIPLPIRSTRRDECPLARALTEIYPPGPHGFGSSDCDCPTHLFHSPDNPLEHAPFHAVLQQFRMQGPTKSVRH
jgi:sugar fermentation stimulation protein A